MLARAYSLPPRTTWIIGAILTAVWLVIYLITVSPTVNFIDSGELITALHEPGIVHPPGYPLYTLMGYVASQLPIGEVAWRVNVFSAFWGAMGVGVMYLLVVSLCSYTEWLLSRRAALTTPSRRRASKSLQAPDIQTPMPVSYSLTIIFSAVAAACLLGAASTFWNRSAQAKMYTLHYFLVLFILWLAVSYRWAYEREDKGLARRFLLVLALALGLSFTNHLMTSLLLPGLAVLLLVGSRWNDRFRALLQEWRVGLPALLLPLLLYAYLPVRSSQGPVMNWGSPTTIPDFGRHISAWQYTVYVQDNIKFMIDSAGRLWDYAFGQWAWLTWLVLLLCLASAVLLARFNLPVFLATFVTGLVTFVFTLRYGISEIEPYLVPLYAMLIISVGTAPTLFDKLIAQMDTYRGRSYADGSASNYGLVISTLIALVALVSIVIQFPRQNRSNDHLAELSVLNVFNSLEKDSIIISDHWDGFVAPSYYMQLVRDVRPDVVVIDNSLLKYPWYLGQLEKRYPWLVANSKDIADTFSREQRKWVDGKASCEGCCVKSSVIPSLQSMCVEGTNAMLNQQREEWSNGENYDVQLLSASYNALLSSFVERNIDKHPAYVFFRSHCDPGMAQQGDESSQIAPNYTRQLAGLGYRLWPKPPADSPPVEPKFDLQGYLNSQTPLDDFAKFNAGCYASALLRTAQAFAGRNDNIKAQELAAQASLLQQAVANR